MEDVAPVNPRRHLSALADDDEIAFVGMASVEAETGQIDVTNTRSARLVRQGFTRFAPNDVLFAKITPCMENGKAAVVPELPRGVGVGSTEFHVLGAIGVLPEYLYYWISQRSFRATAEFHMTGTAGQKRVPPDFLRDCLIALPERATQRRIVARIAELFAEIDNGEAALARARDDLATWRKALLKAAVTGELTADWRVANPPTETGADLLARILAERRTRWLAEPRNRGNRSIELPARDTLEPSHLPAGWGWTTLGSVFDVFVGSTPPRGEARLWGGDIPWVSSGEVSFCRIRSTRETIRRDALGDSRKRLHPPGTVMLGMIGEGKTRGQAAILDVWAAHNQNCASIRVSETPILPEFVYLFLCERYEETRSGSSGGNQLALNKARIEGFAMPVPPVEEQREIVMRIDLAEAAWDGDLLDGGIAAALRQSILAAAFRGELLG